MVWSGSRTRDTRITSPMLYPSELSSGWRAGIEPATCRLQTCRSPSEPTPSWWNIALEAPAYADGNAARTGWGLSPCRWNLSVRCSRLPAVANRQWVWAFLPDLLVSISRTARAEASGRSAHAPVAAAPLPRSRLTGCFRAKRIPQTLFDAWASLANGKNKTPPGLQPEGVRVASGDRGDRSPRRDQSIIGKRLPGRSLHRAQTGLHRGICATYPACSNGRGGMAWKVSS